MLSIDQKIEGEIESLAFGGEGILRHQGFVIFVPFTAPGDRIVCRITNVKRSFAKGVLVEILTRSKDRVKPPCPYFGTCGGCQLQHLNLQTQLQYKLNAVTDALKRIGHLSFPPFSIQPAEKNWAYRQHITLHLRPKGVGFEAGYIGQDNRSLVVIKECPIFTEASNPIIPLLQNLVAQIANPHQEGGRVILLKNHRGQYIFSFQFGPQFEIRKSLFEMMLQNPLVAGIAVQTPQKEWILGDIFCEQQIEGLTFRYSPKTFIQNHPDQSAAIARQICRLASSQKNILDLYCGYGTTSLLLGKQGHSVLGMEWNQHAIQFAKENASLNGLKNVCFQQGDVEKLLPHWVKNNKADLIIVNPPRQGLAKGVVETLLTASPQSIIYVSCMPATLARDLGTLSAAYKIKGGYVYDMFPQTAHVETLVLLGRI